MFIAFRFLAGLGGSAPQSIDGGVIGDLFDAEPRGQAISTRSSRWTCRWTYRWGLGRGEINPVLGGASLFLFCHIRRALFG